jgi:hypothetical protein
MVVKQTAAQRNRKIAQKALFAPIAVAAGIELSGMAQGTSGIKPIHSIEYSVMVGACFILTYMYIWLTAKRNLQICIDEQGFELSHDEDSQRLRWYEVKAIKQPRLLRPWWVFEFKKGDKLKVVTTHFNSKQVKTINRKLSQIPLRK